MIFSGGTEYLNGKKKKKINKFNNLARHEADATAIRLLINTNNQHWTDFK
jgi:hypothetical protein